MPEAEPRRGASAPDLPVLPIRRKLAFVVLGFSLSIVALVGVAWGAMDALSAVRGFVAGEGLWSKAEKDATLALVRYAQTHREADYQRFLGFLEVPLGDREARLELEKPVADLDVADRGFIRGGNHPDDVRAMGNLFRRFRRVPHLDRAIAVWAQGDVLLDELMLLGAELHGDISSGRASAGTIDHHLDRLDDLNRRLTALENEFSATLGEAARWLGGVLVAAMVVVAALFLAVGVSFSWRVSRDLLRGVARLREGTARVGGGDLTQRIPIHTRDEFGEIAEAFNRMTDALAVALTQQRRAEAALAARAAQLDVANRELVEQDKLKSQFFSNVAHELRTPLSLILSPIESLLGGEYGPMAPGVERIVGSIGNNAGRLLQIVQGLLDIQKLDAGKVEVRREPTDVGALTRSIFDDFAPMIQQRSLTAELSAPASVLVDLDRYLYERLLFNLLSNAVKFTPAGGRVSVSLALDGGRLALAVRDTGIGIAAPDQATLFRAFRQVEGSSTRRFEGVGLGLALVREFAGLLGGTASVESTVGQGSTFTVEVLAPRASGPAAQPLTRRPRFLPTDLREAGAAVEAPASVLPAPTARVLVVEDNAELARYICEVLAPVALTRRAGDGEEALAVTREWLPDLVLSDAMMPRLDGIGLCRALKAEATTQNIPFVLLSALTYRDALLRGWEAGADDYLFKPFHPQELVARVRAILATQKAMNDARQARDDAEESLRASRTQLAEAQSLAQLGSWQWDPRADTVAWSEELFRMFGLDPATFRASFAGYLERVAPEDRGRVRGLIGEALRSHEPFEFEHGILKPDGTRRILHSRGRVIVDESGEPTRMMGTVQDVTARHLAAEQLRSSEERHRLLFEFNPQPMWVYDTETLGFLAVNEAAIRRYGYSRQEFARMSVRDLQPRDERVVFNASVEPDPLRRAVRHKTGSGDALQVELHAHDFSFDGRPARLLLANDVTEKLALAEQARLAQKMEAIGQLAGGVAHDFNNILTVMLSYTEMMIEDLEDGNQHRADLEEIRAAGNRATHLTRQLLAFGRRQVLQPKSVDLNAVVAEISKMLRRLIGEDIELLTAPAEDLGHVFVDPGQLEQVIVNLAVNARDAMPHGGKLTIETANVELDAEYARSHPGVTAGPYVMLAVSDAGSGMTAEVQAKIFEPFFTTKATGKGTGLGLAMVYGIVRQSQGSIFVYSELGHGTTFKVYLPRVEVRHLEPTPSNTVPSPPRGKETILVVEDEPPIRELACRILREHGYDAIEVLTPAEAESLCANHDQQIDLLLTDVVMPQVGGPELARRLRALRPHLRVLFMSGYPGGGIVRHGVLDEGVALLEKPFTPTTLLNKVRAVIDLPS